jgi:DUF1365 family protein
VASGADAKEAAEFRKRMAWKAFQVSPFQVLQDKYQLVYQMFSLETMLLYMVLYVTTSELLQAQVFSGLLAI